MLLWPDAENWPEGGEVDFMEIGDETRQKADFFLHYGANNRQLHGEVQIDATQWHNWAVEWSPQKITAYVDGKEWYSTTQVSALPPDSMHLTLQLDWFPKGGSVQPSTMQVDWVRYYPIDGSGDPGTIVDSQGTTSGTGATLARIAGSAEPATTGGSTTGDGAGGGSDGATSSAEKTVTVTVDPTTPAPSSPAGTATSATTSITEPEPAAVGGSAGNAADTAVPADLDENGVGTSAAPGTSE
jgi:hypothetical protein